MLQQASAAAWYLIEALNLTDTCTCEASCKNLEAVATNVLKDDADVGNTRVKRCPAERKTTTSSAL